LNPQKSREILSRHLPVESVSHISQMVERYRIRLRITRGRATKLGDFKPEVNGGGHQITVNGDLNIYAFLLVFTHELAHLLVHERHQNQLQTTKVFRQTAPHGKEWKKQYGELIRLFVGQGYFHPLLDESLLQYSHHVRASGVASDDVVRELRLFDNGQAQDGLLLLEEVPGNAYFYSRTGRLFRKGERVRKRFRCCCMDNQRAYLFHPMARVRLKPEDTMPAKKENAGMVLRSAT
jgi:SprT protein